MRRICRSLGRIENPSFPPCCEPALDRRFVFSSSLSISPSAANTITGSTTASAMAQTIRMSGSSLTDHNQVSTATGMIVRLPKTTPSQTTGSSSHEIIEGYLTDTSEDGISQNDHDIAEFHRSRKYSVRCVVVPTLDEVEIVKSRHFLAISSQATM